MSWASISSLKVFSVNCSSAWRRNSVMFSKPCQFRCMDAMPSSPVQVNLHVCQFPAAQRHIRLVLLLVSNRVALQTATERDHYVDLVGNLLDVLMDGRSEERLTEVPDEAERGVPFLPATLAGKI
ncbi:hypothetical protein DPMN_159386 [Dreissena polymorpha]|uniref:Uncharacterized protein n=1 Tax=Dreissena polymorpha TaxID=45954 RepID=A0A9D4EKM9_DREPO|nr:hypothetical protein DPMN_159386 [Dreissena polymorpha]